MEQAEIKTAPSRLKKNPIKPILIIIIAVVLIILVGYTGLCYFVSQNETLYPNTTVNGIDIGGMTEEEAISTVMEAVATQLSDLEATFLCGDTQYGVSGSEFTADPAPLVAEALSYQESSFLSKGFHFLQAFSGNSDYQTIVTLEHSPTIISEAAVEALGSSPYATWEVDGDFLLIQKGITGNAIDEVALTELLGEQMNALVLGESVEPIEAPIAVVSPTDPDFDAIYDEIFVAPVDAYLDADSKEIISGTSGISFDVDWVESHWADVDEGDTLIVALTYDAPALDTEAFEDLLFADLLASTQTNCSGTAARLSNVDTVCDYVNGTILLPGETFSYTDVCGPFSASNGYQSAGAYVAGMSVEAMAGGICQLSSTLYWATLEANLEIVERTKHSYNTGYMPVLGTDATIYEGLLDFQFSNNTEHPILIECWRNTSTSVVTVNIYGTNTTGLHGDVYSVIVETRTPVTYYEANESQAIGTTSVDPERTAYTGYTVDVYRNQVDDEGNVVETEYLYRNTYSYRDKVIFYNPADAASLGIDTATGTLIPQTTEPSAEEPTVEEPTTTDSTVDTPEVEEPAVEEPVVDTTTEDSFTEGMLPVESSEDSVTEDVQNDVEADVEITVE